MDPEEPPGTLSLREGRSRSAFFERGARNIEPDGSVRQNRFALLCSQRQFEFLSPFDKSVYRSFVRIGSLRVVLPADVPISRCLYGGGVLSLPHFNLLSFQIGTLHRILSQLPLISESG